MKSCTRKATDEKLHTKAVHEKEKISVQGKVYNEPIN